MRVSQILVVGYSHLVLLGVEDQVDQGHEVPLVGAEVGPVGAGADSVEEDQVLGSGCHVWQNLVKLDFSLRIIAQCPLDFLARVYMK